MERLTVRELSRETAAVLDRVERGETIEVQRGRRVVARVVPSRADEERDTGWNEHLAWFKAAARPGRRRGKDPVDEVLVARRGRDTFR